MSSPKLVAGIDIGGTNVRCALAEQGQPGVIQSRTSRKTPLEHGTSAILSLIEDEISSCLESLGSSWSSLQSIGCTAPGITDSKSGIVIDAANLPGWLNVPLAEQLADRFRRPAIIENDVNAAALGEALFGAGKARHSSVYLTISTGVAAGIVLEDNLMRGFHHAAGEVGFYLPAPEHIGKEWGHNGCLEMTSTGIGLAKEWANLRGGSDASDRATEVFEAAEEGDADAIALVDRAADYLALVSVAIGTLIDPEILVLGGSIAKHQPGIVSRIQEVVSSTILSPPIISLADLGGDAPLIGALILADRLVS